MEKRMEVKTHVSKVFKYVVSFVLIALIAAFPVIVNGEWFCEACNEYRDTEYCPICGAHSPEESSSVWICPTCGKELPAEYRFCPDDRTERGVPGNKWPVKQLNRSSTSLKSFSEEKKRHQSYFGPDAKAYGGAGAYKPYKVTSAFALFREGNFVYVDMSYSTVGRRCVYFKSTSVTNASVEEISLSTYAATVKHTVQPMFGPGNQYDVVDKTVTNQKTGKTRQEKIELSAGTSVNVFFETDGWVFAEFGCSLGTIRAWLPVSSIQ